jgi:hypothetical protein
MAPTSKRSEHAIDPDNRAHRRAPSRQVSDALAKAARSDLHVWTDPAGSTVILHPARS